jgi:hypothetical protein
VLLIDINPPNKPLRKIRLAPDSGRDVNNQCI